MDKKLFFPLKNDEILFISHNNYFLAIVKSLGKSFFLETDEEEIVLGTRNNDILAASSLINGKKMKPILKTSLYTLRELSFPLIVLKKGHPASKKLKLVFGFGDQIVLDSCIEAGTHPEQHLLCSVESLSGLCILATEEGIEIVDPMCREIKVEKDTFELRL